jgi:SAM-dependent methyltransferase
LNHLSDELFAWIERWLPPPPARLLDVGCGDGASTRRLQAAGFVAVGVDPDAPAEEGFLRLPLEALPRELRFDAALAIRSLHHVHALEEALDRLHAALRPRGRLVVLEFAIESLDEAAHSWLHRRGLAYEVEDANEVTSLAEVRAAIERRFRLLHHEPASYLASELGYPEFVNAEEEAIRRGELRSVGARLAYEAIP